MGWGVAQWHWACLECMRPTSSPGHKKSLLFQWYIVFAQNRTIKYTAIESHS